VPYLIEALNRRDGLIRTSWIKLRGHFPAWPDERVAQPTPAALVRVVACCFLDSLGVSARPAIPKLIRAIRDDDDEHVRAIAAEILGNIADGRDKPVVEALIAATRDKNFNVRASAWGALTHLNPAAAAKAGITNSGAGISP
jgi:hypothetical protein